jgi:hypothetical protein
MRKEEYAERTTHPDSPFRRFNVACLKCGSVRLRVVGQFDVDSGEVKIFLSCPQCRAREQLPVF